MSAAAMDARVYEAQLAMQKWSERVQKQQDPALPARMLARARAVHALLSRMRAEGHDVALHEVKGEPLQFDCAWTALLAASFAVRELRAQEVMGDEEVVLRVKV